jgi:hypothetical protein
VSDKRRVGTGHLYEKWGSHYGRWRTADGRLLNRKVGEIRAPGGRKGLTAAQAEREFRKLQEAEEGAPRARPGDEIPTVAEIGRLLRERKEISGASESYLESCEYIERIHIAPSRAGKSRPADVSTADVEALARELLKKKLMRNPTKTLSPTTVRNILGYLYAIFELAVKEGWARDNPVRQAERPGRLQAAANPDLQFLTVSELEAVLRAIPDEVVQPKPKPTRKGRRGPAPPPSRDVDGLASRRAARPALARCRLGRSADPRAQAG